MHTMRRTERRVGVFAVLSVFVGGSIVAAAVSRPSGSARVALAVGVFYLEAVAALSAFARASALDAGTMNAVYGLLAYVVWWGGSYLVMLGGLGLDRTTIRTVALASLGLAVSLSGAAAALAGLGGVVGVLELDRPASLAALFAGIAVAILASLWTDVVRSGGADVGWGLTNLEYTNTAVEVGVHLLLLSGLGLFALAVVAGVGAQYLVVALLGVALVAVSVVVP